MATETVTIPTVYVVENPDQFPDVYASGEVNIVNLSSYPATKDCTDRGTEYPEYPEEMEAAAATVEATNPDAATYFKYLASEYRRRLAAE